MHKTMGMMVDNSCQEKYETNEFHFLNNGDHRILAVLARSSLLHKRLRTQAVHQDCRPFETIGRNNIKSYDDLRSNTGLQNERIPFHRRGLINHAYVLRDYNNLCFNTIRPHGLRLQIYLIGHEFDNY